MGKRINKKAKEGKETFFGIYQKKFELLELGTKKHLRDEKSDRGSFVPIEICGDSVYLSEPDGKLIPDDHGQQKCDFLLYCSDLPQISIGIKEPLSDFSSQRCFLVPNSNNSNFF